MDKDSEYPVVTFMRETPPMVLHVKPSKSDYSCMRWIRELIVTACCLFPMSWGSITNMGAQAIRIQQLWDMLDAWQIDGTTRMFFCSMFCSMFSHTWQVFNCQEDICSASDCPREVKLSNHNKTFKLKVAAFVAQCSSWNLIMFNVESAW